MKTVAIIPARGGSKGIPDKNLRTVGKESLLARAIGACQEAGIEVFVSTDSDKIAKEASKKGAFVVKRPEELSSDTASSEAALLHAIDFLPSQVDIVVFVQATSPFIKSSDIKSAIGLIENNLAESVFSAAEDHAFRWTRESSEWIPDGHDKKSRPRRQDLPETVRETGAFYVFAVSSFLAEKTRFCGTTVAQLTDARFSVDIDTVADLDLANALEPAWAEPRDQRLNDLETPDKAAAIKAIAYDFDGVMTTNTAILREDGVESVLVSRSDGFGVRLLREIGIAQAIISLETNPVVKTRADKLGIPCWQGIEDKLEIIKNWAQSLSLELSEVAYVGNDLNDIPAMRQVGFSVAVSDAHPEVKSIAHHVLAKPGGSGAIREFAELIIKNKEK